MAMIIKRISTGLFDGHWSLLTTINGGLAGMVGKHYVAICDWHVVPAARVKTSS